ncbi:MAG: hypothetical protein A3D52_01000 [Candidatus Taylorbacteria bacterium RIFCSPHIGHO2_02_FULL_44_36]|uniref:RNA polymerase sigma-70 domain-containing protein n=1 Tax=Candidatus Taylorbacteria bacterium RIFCSPLOWO2_12_FULL_44_15c TaxID=1802333 RepID=A0A1G2P619_9BACT|nr:MAG: hypothetical protein A3D52_01000 [Candidatus Taylorbacteria bacterium RIFCSPHIGHO2_02_FULL_44_36]OHA43787.1 MAG: hypothetical protein A3G03_02060 [Candidatus Taylorbacteria bacterium RIFCSPLOWO2_12_FULL_44_15c]
MNQAVNSVFPNSEYEKLDAFQSYCRQINEVPLLSREEERELARQIKKGDEKAREQMIKANLRLVVKIARGYEHFGLPLLDLISEGNIGLMKAVDRFDPRQAKLSTYASMWIRQRITRALTNQSRIIRIPVHAISEIASVNKMKTEIRSQGHKDHEVINRELADKLGTTTEHIRELQLAEMRPISLDVPVGVGDSRFGDSVEDPTTKNPARELEEKSDKEYLHRLLGKLSDRDATIIRLRYGLNGGEVKTLEEIGWRFGVTREAVRQIQTKAERKLRRMMEREKRILDLPLGIF